MDRLMSDDVREKLQKLKENRSITSRLRTHLRKLILSELNCGPTASWTPVITVRSRALGSLIVEWLRLHDCHYTLSVLASEVPSLSDLPGLASDGSRTGLQKKEAEEVLLSLELRDDDVMREYMNSSESLLSCIATAAATWRRRLHFLHSPVLPSGVSPAPEWSGRLQQLVASLFTDPDQMTHVYYALHTIMQNELEECLAKERRALLEERTRRENDVKKQLERHEEFLLTRLTEAEQGLCHSKEKAYEEISERRETLSNLLAQVYLQHQAVLDGLADLSKRESRFEVMKKTWKIEMLGERTRLQEKADDLAQKLRLFQDQQQTTQPFQHHQTTTTQNSGRMERFENDGLDRSQDKAKPLQERSQDIVKPPQGRSHDIASDAESISSSCSSSGGASAAAWRRLRDLREASQLSRASIMQFHNQLDSESESPPEVNPLPVPTAPEVGASTALTAPEVGALSAPTGPEANARLALLANAQVTLPHAQQGGGEAAADRSDRCRHLLGHGDTTRAQPTEGSSLLYPSLDHRDARLRLRQETTSRLNSLQEAPQNPRQLPGAPRNPREPIHALWNPQRLSRLTKADPQGLIYTLRNSHLPQEAARLSDRTAPRNSHPRQESNRLNRLTEDPRSTHQMQETHRLHGFQEAPRSPQGLSRLTEPQRNPQGLRRLMEPQRNPQVLSQMMEPQRNPFQMRQFRIRRQQEKEAQRLQQLLDSMQLSPLNQAKQSQLSCPGSNSRQPDDCNQSNSTCERLEGAEADSGGHSGSLKRTSRIPVSSNGPAQATQTLGLKIGSSSNTPTPRRKRTAAVDGASSKPSNAQTTAFEGKSDPDAGETKTNPSGGNEADSSGNSAREESSRQNTSCKTSPGTKLPQRVGSASWNMPASTAANGLLQAALDSSDLSEGEVVSMGRRQQSTRDFWS